jgi:hypothetical protein
MAYRKLTMDEARDFVLDLCREHRPESLADARRLIRASEYAGQESRLQLALLLLIDAKQLRVNQNYRFIYADDLATA